MRPRAELSLAYAFWAEEYVAEGWTPYLLTFMFHPLGGSPMAVARQMECEVERVYATLLTRMVRKPTAVSSVRGLPVWFCAHDRPIFKHEKVSIKDVTLNDGAHIHAVAFLPPWSRLRGEKLDDHLAAHTGLYIRAGLPLRRLHVEPITHDAGYVVDYVRKQTEKSVIGQDASFVLPRSLAEVRSRAA